MADSVNVRIEDDEGNKYYVQTTAENVLLKDGSTLEQKLEEIPREIIDSVAIISSSSGEEIEITDSAEAPLMGLKLYATCEQTQYSGIQMIPYWEIGGIDSEGKEQQGAGYGWRTPFIQVDYHRDDYRYDNAGAPYMSTFFACYNSTETFIEKISPSQNEGIITFPSGTYKIRIHVAQPIESAIESAMLYRTDTYTSDQGAKRDYEPYCGNIPSPNSDYPQEIKTIPNFVVEVKNNMGATAALQTLNITIPEQGFWAVPVENDGNYTDSTGQQWMSDIIDLQRGKLIKNIKKASVIISSMSLGSGSEKCGYFKCPDKRRYRTQGALNLLTGFLCTKGRKKANWWDEIYVSEGQTDFRFWGTENETLETFQEKFNGTDFYYILSEPIEYDLSDEQIQAFMELHTYKPTTYITNDAELPVNMEAKYVADLQAYINNKIAALSNNGEE